MTCMTTRERLHLSVKRGGRHDVETSYRFDVYWLKETTVRGLLAHVLAKINSNLCLDDAEEITVIVMLSLYCPRLLPMEHTDYIRAYAQ